MRRGRRAGPVEICAVLAVTAGLAVVAGEMMRMIERGAQEPVVGWLGGVGLVGLVWLLAWVSLKRS